MIKKRIFCLDGLVCILNSFANGVCGGGCSEVVGRLLALFDVGADAVDLGVKFEKVLATKIDRAQRAML